MSGQSLVLSVIVYVLRQNCRAAGWWRVLNNYNNSSFYIIHHNDSHRICPSSVQLSEGSTLGLPLSVKTCKHRFLKNLQADKRGGETAEPIPFIILKRLIVY
jgi:hypothetical protein